LFQGKEREFAWGLGLDDFLTRTYDPFTGRMWQVDGADQFASGYVGMGNNAVNGIDPDGQIWHIAIGAAVGGLINLGTKFYQGKIHSFKDGAVAFGIGAVAGGIIAATGGAAGVYASTGSFAGAFSSAAVAASSTGVIGGAVAGTVGSAFGSGVQGLGNAAYFGDPYSASDYGRDVLFGGIFGGVSGGLEAAWQGKPLFTGGNNYFRPQRPNLGGGVGRIKIGDVTGEFPAISHPDGNVTQTTFSVGGATEGVLNPNEIHFMQSSIKNTTGNFTVLGNAEALANGSLNPNILRMNVWKDASGKVWTLDHRRLGAFRLSGLQEAPIQWANPTGQMWKMTTTNGGTSIKLKLGGGNNMIIK